MEVTSVDESLARAKCNERGHIHLDDVVEHSAAFDGNEVSCPIGLLAWIAD